MVGQLLNKIFGSRNDRLVKRMLKNVSQVNAFEGAISKLDDGALQGKTVEFRDRFKKGESLDQLLPEAFAVVRETGKRVLQMRHFDVQLLGGMVLHQGKISEMRTGEGKTLVATLAAYLNALSGKGVHVVTVNDYLARRDAEWMGKIYRFLGLDVGVILSGQSREEKMAAYAADITYGTNNEYGFDYLRDNMAFRREERMQRSLNFAIVDEVDSILIDEARTPLIISGEAEDSSELYISVNALVPKLIKQEEEDGPGDYSLDEKTKQVYLTEAGHERVENMLGEANLLTEGGSLYDASNIGLFHHVNAAMRAQFMFQKDVDYIVNGGQVVIVDEFTGRTMPGRRWSDGLHQAVEAKENVRIQNESQTLASITFQNYFRMYDKLSGMTGTADTEAFEFQQIYGLEVVVVPTHRPMIRKDKGDLVFLTVEEKYEAIVEDIKDCRKRGQPVLVGTASIESSKYLHGILEKDNIQHEVLNAKQHEREAYIVAQAGRPGAITIATNMAGRGTDIVLGGSLESALSQLGDNPSRENLDQTKQEWQSLHDDVINAGGLHIIGTERHESRRIDNQLRGRSGRQGDPGSSRFYLSLQDNLMRIFASDRVASIMQRLGMKRGEAIEHGLVSRAIENAQRKVEGHNFDIRKNLLKYDDVANEQRKTIYRHRDELMSVERVDDRLDSIRGDVINDLITSYIPANSMEEQWDISGLKQALSSEFDFKENIAEWLEQDSELHEEVLRDRIVEGVDKAYRQKDSLYGEENMRFVEKAVMLQVLDNLWKEHLAAMDYLRQGIQWVGYAQKNPEQEYKTQAFKLFTQMLNRYKQEVVSLLAKVQIQSEAIQQFEEPSEPSHMQFQHAEYSGMSATAQPGEQADLDEYDDKPAPYVRETKKVGRNEPCPCGSGKKYKQCHGRL